MYGTKHSESVDYFEYRFSSWNEIDIFYSFVLYYKNLILLIHLFPIIHWERSIFCVEVAYWLFELM